MAKNFYGDFKVLDSRGPQDRQNRYRKFCNQGRKKQVEESTQEALLNKWRKIARKQDIKAGVAIILLAIIGIGRVIGLGYLSSPLLRLYGQFIFFGVLTLAFSVLRIWYNKKRGLLEEAFPEEFSAFQKKKVEVDKAKAARSAARKAARRASAVEKVLKDYGIEIA